MNEVAYIEKQVQEFAAFGTVIDGKEIFIYNKVPGNRLYIRANLRNYSTNFDVVFTILKNTFRTSFSYVTTVWP